jgi:hypothetical protein
MKTLTIALSLTLVGCATNPGLDHRIVCTLEGKAAFAETYGPIALFQTAPDANVICGSLIQTPTVSITPPVIAPAAAPAASAPSPRP